MIFARLLSGSLLPLTGLFLLMGALAACASPEASPTPEPSATPTQEPTSTATPSPSPEPSTTPTPEPTLEPSPTLTPTPAPSATPTQEVAPEATPTQTPEPQSLEDLAISLVTMMSERRFDEVVANFDETMASALPVETVEQTWDSLLAQVGEFQGIEGTEVVPSGEYTIVRVEVAFENQSMRADITFDDNRKVAGLFFNPADSYAPPDYADPSSFSERDVTVGSAPWELPGTLTVPNGDGPFPAVVLVHGSGPQDRDETIGSNKPFKDLAWGLASQGIAVLRYEKRTAYYPQEMADIADEITIYEEAVVDAVAAVELLRTTPDIDADRVFVVGHSLGGALAPLITAEAEGVAGTVILAGAMTPLDDLIVEQAHYLAELDGTVTPQEQAQLDAIEAEVAKVREMDFEPGETVLGGGQAYWQSLADYDIAATAAGLDVPVLALQGGRDYQVPPRDLDAWRDALSENPDAEFREYEALNHLFIAGEGPSSPQEYLVHGSVYVEVVEDIAEWVQQDAQ